MTDQLALIVCGSRDWTNRNVIGIKLDEFEVNNPNQLIVVEGGARGADAIAKDWASKARRRGVGWLHLPAKWTEHAEGWCPSEWCRTTRRSCLGAGTRRNQEMLDYVLQAPRQFVLAFKVDFDLSRGTGGTEDMVRRAKAAGVHGTVVRQAETASR